MSKSRPQHGVRNQLIANREINVARQQRRNSVQAIEHVIGRPVHSRAQAKKSSDHPLAMFRQQMSEMPGNNKVGAVVPREELMLRYLGSSTITELCADYFERKGIKGKLTPRGLKDSTRSVMSDLRSKLAEQSAHDSRNQLANIAQVTRYAQDWLEDDEEVMFAEDPGAYFTPGVGEVRFRMRRQIIDDGVNTLGLGVKTADHDTQTIITSDLTRINSALSAIGLLPPGAVIDYEELDLWVPMFEIESNYGVRDRNGPTIPLVPLADVSFQPLGVHEIAKTA